MTEINFATILADIRAASDEQRAHKLKHAAAQEFARLNGWVTGGKIFTPESLVGKRPRVCHSMPGGVFDHTLHCRAGRGNAAIISEPYADCRDQAAALAASLGIELHIPPNPRASIWAPGHAFFLCFTAPGHAIQWLPEQMVRP